MSCYVGDPSGSIAGSPSWIILVALHPVLGAVDERVAPEADTQVSTRKVGSRVK